MRTTLAIAIDDDVLAAANVIAAQQGRSVGQVISDLARRQLNQAQPVQERNGIPLLIAKPGSPPITLEFVNKHR
ncbi:CopG family transcriptional regulator [Rhizobium tubonense]|uniref:CopG family transcriptional regulator n=1 Tax=Rhizobium tubonense TaxID=484088 RepID=A0A2W4CKK7_9HYPH|nr:CopG family transcriptional regulator [Rhizobium tubonense]PZM13141.1 CopG family transcriptional regulator [Rhizobium tubonense]